MSAEARLAQTRLDFWRKQELLKSGWATRAQFDNAQQAFQTSQAQLDSARAQVRLTEDQLSYTVLSADGPGAVTAVGAEPGEVVRAGGMIVQVARQGGRDAVFDVPEQLMRTGPRYLGAFSWRFNRRFVLKTIHERLAIAATATPPMPYRLLKLAEARW